MPEELASAENLFEKHSSIPFNPKLAGVFFKSGMVETWGRGFEKIKEACDEHGTPLPEYKISSNGVMVLCKPNELYMSLRHNNGINDTNLGTNGTKSDLVNDSVNRILTRNICGLNCGLTEIAVLNHVIENPKATQKEIATTISTSLRTVESTFSKLKEANIIYRDGSKKNGKWIIREEAAGLLIEKNLIVDI